jgi:hypothetical protein
MARKKILAMISGFMAGGVVLTLLGISPQMAEAGFRMN